MFYTWPLASIWPKMKERAQCHDLRLYTDFSAPSSFLTFSLYSDFSALSPLPAEKKNKGERLKMVRRRKNVSMVIEKIKTKNTEPGKIKGTVNYSFRFRIWKIDA